MFLRPATRAVSTAFALAMAACLALPRCRRALIDLTPLAAPCNSVGSISLADPAERIRTAGIIVGDKVFTGFSYSASAICHCPPTLTCWASRIGR